MIRPILSLDRLTFLEPEGKVSYRSGHPLHTAGPAPASIKLQLGWFRVNLFI